VSSTDFADNLRALWRADRIIAEIRMRHLLVGFGLRAFALVIAAFGLLMLELAAYFALVQVWSAIVAAAALGAINFVLAAAIFVFAGRQPSGREFELANEVHGRALDALQSDLRGLQTQFTETLHNPLNSVLPTLIVPLVTIAIRSLRRAKSARAAEESDS
jgi:hypothetical protein